MKKKNKSILWITNNWVDDFGGRKIMSKRILNFLQIRGYLITVLDFEIKTKNLDDKKKFIQLNEDITFIPIYLKGNKGAFLENLKYSKNQHFDFVIISAYSIIDILTIISIRLFNLHPQSKIILLEHTNPLKGIQVSRFWLIHNVLAHLFYKRFDHIVTPGTDLKKMFIEEFGVNSRKIHFIHYPIIYNKIFKLMKEPVKYNFFGKNGSKIIITSARFNLDQKDYFTLLRAFKIVLRTFSSKLVILGTGSDQKKVELLAENLKIKNNLIFLGFQENPFKYIYNSDVFVLSSHFEGAPVVLVEAMACGTPIVSSSCDFGPKEILENDKNGILVPVRDYNKMAESILTILKNRQLSNSLIINGLKKAKNYNIKNSLNCWDKFLLNISRP